MSAQEAAELTAIRDTATTGRARVVTSGPVLGGRDWFDSRQRSQPGGVELGKERRPPLVLGPQLPDVGAERVGITEGLVCRM
jgi:hypothetical protein